MDGEGTRRGGPWRSLKNRFYLLNFSQKCAATMLLAASNTRPANTKARTRRPEENDGLGQRQTVVYLNQGFIIIF